MIKIAKKLIFSIVSIGLGVFFSLITIEAYLRFVVDKQYDYPAGLYQNDPDVGMRLTPSFEGNHTQITTDFNCTSIIPSDGFRTNDSVATKIPSFQTPFTVFLGDSFTFGVGVGVGYNETFPAVYERLTKEQALNAGSSRFNLHESLLRLEFNILNQATPDKVFLCIFLGNDLVPFTDSPAATMTAQNGFAVQAGSSLRLERRLRRYWRTWGFIANVVST